MPDLKTQIRDSYGRSAARVLAGTGGASCGTACCGDSTADVITSGLYDAAELDTVPEKAALASLGCGNPTALAELREGEVVLDLGSGGGIDVLLSARRVGPTGKAYGLDMTDEMLELAERNKSEAGVTNVEFLKGEIENIPLPDASVDVIISNCVINLSGDKERVLREAFRVLKPGGRFAVSDVAARGDPSPELRRNMEAWIGCVAGALSDTDYARLLASAGFTEISIEPTRFYTAGDTGCGVESSEADAEFMSAFIRATKPATGSAQRNPSV